MSPFNTISFILLLAMVFVAGGHAQTFQHKPVKDFENSIINYDSLEVAYGAQDIDVQFKREFLIVRQYYPELAHQKIQLKFKKRSSRMISARPRIRVFGSRRSRRYSIVIEAGSVNTVLDYTLNARIGLFAHEFSHLAYYHTKSNAALAAFGVHYALSKSFHHKIEQATDTDVVTRGLGWQLKDYQLYLKDSELEKLMRDLGY